MNKVRLMGVLVALVVYSNTESWLATVGSVAVVELYAIGWLLQSIHAILVDLHARMDGGYPPAP